MLEIIKAIILGIVEGITEWLPISSTGHMILVNEFMKMKMSQAFMDMFLVVIQLGAILAVVVLFWKDIWPFKAPNKGLIKSDKFVMWFKILVACIPAVIFKFTLDDKAEEMFYNYQTVSIMLIVVGILFIIVENWNKDRQSSINEIAQITYLNAFLIGVFQLVAAVFPGTSRSGATIIGGLLLGLSRTVAAEFTFYLAIPVMFGASLVKIKDFGLAFTSLELTVLIVGMVVAFLVSLIVIKFLMSYIKKHDFKVFGWYRIILGLIVITYFMFF